MTEIWRRNWNSRAPKFVTKKGRLGRNRSSDSLTVRFVLVDLHPIVEDFSEVVLLLDRTGEQIVRLFNRQRRGDVPALCPVHPELLQGVVLGAGLHTFGYGLFNYHHTSDASHQLTVRGDGGNVAGSGRNHNDQAFRLILDAAVNGDTAAYDETRRFLGSLTVSSDNETIRFLDVAWLFFQGEFSDSRLVEVDPGSIHLWVQVLQAWARFEIDHMHAPALARISELSVFHDIQDLTALFEARVRLAEGDAAAASQLAEGSLRQLVTQCQIESEACAWVPLAEWVFGEALRSIDGREVEAEAVLASAAEHAPNTWIATSLTR